MRHPGVLAAIAAVSLVAPAPAAASPKDLTAWLDDDAPVVISVRPAFLERAATMAADSFGKELPDLRQGLTLVSAGTGGALGFDILSAKGWRKAGFDPREPMLMSLAAIDDAGAKKVYDKLFSFDKWTDRKLRSVKKVYWRSRLVLRVDDAAKVERTIQIVARTAPDLFRVHDDNAAEIAMLVGERPRKADKLLERLRKRDIEAIGWLPGLDSFLAFRFDGKRRFLLVDVVGSFAGVPTVWPRDSRRLLGVIEREPGTSKLTRRLARGAGLDALDADLAIWIQPRAMLDTAKATGRHRVLQVLAAGAVDRKRVKKLHRAASAEIDRCDAFRPFANKGAFVDVAFTLDLDTSGLTGTTRWGLRKGFKLRAAMQTADDGLLSWGKPTDAVIVAAHYLDGLGALRSLPRPKLLAGGFDDLTEATFHCGSGGTLVAALFGWPQIAGAALERISDEDEALDAILDGLRNSAVAVKQIGETEADWVAAWAGSFEKPAATAVRKVVEATARSAGKQVRLAGESVRAWTVDALRVFAYRTPKGRRAFGAAIGNGAAAWLLRAAGASSKPPLARWTVDLPELFAQLAALEPGSAATYKALARKLARVDGALEIDGDTLTAAMKLSFR